MSEAICVAPTSCVLGNGPVWSPSDGFLWWTDLRKAKLHRFNPKTGNTRRYDLPIRASALGLSKGRLLMAGDLEIGLYDPETEDYQRLVALPETDTAMRINDGRVAPDGSFWFGTCDEEGERHIGAYYRLAPEGELEPLRLNPAPISYSFCFSLGAETFYTCDTAAQEILAFDHDPETGVLSERRVLASTGEAGCYPDGAAIDCDGFLWSAQWAGARIVRYAPDGRIDRVVELPVTRPTNCVFGGADMKTLFVTTARAGLSNAALDRQPMAGCLFAIDAPVPGLPIAEWGGA